MFVSFNKVFNKKPQSQTEVPQAMLDYMNNQLPKGIKYISSDDGRCTIVSESGSFTLGGLIFRPTEEQKKILGKNYTYNDVTAYFYNAQKQMPLELKRDGYITLNGQDIPIDQISYNPMLPSVKYVSGSFMAFPQKFPPPFSLIVGVTNGSYSRTLTVSRIPNESVHVAMFQSKENEPLMIKYSIDEKNNKLKMSLIIDLKYAKTIRDIVESTMIYNAYLSGDASLCGTPLDVITYDGSAEKFDLKSALFWEKVMKIEECLSVSFVPPMEDVSNDDIILVEELYQNLVNHVPIRDTQKLTSIGGNWDLNDANRDIKNSVGLAIFFQFHSIVEAELFGVKFSLPILTGVCNARIKEINTKEGKPKLVLEDESEEKKQYVCTMFFLSEGEMKAYIAMGINEMVKIFETAKTVREYLSGTDLRT